MVMKQKRRGSKGLAASVGCFCFVSDSSGSLESRRAAGLCRSQQDQQQQNDQQQRDS